MSFDKAILEELTVGIDVTGSLRILEATHRTTPTCSGHGETRFSSPTGSFTVLYAAQNLPTALPRRSSVTGSRESDGACSSKRICENS